MKSFLTIILLSILSFSQDINKEIDNFKVLKLNVNAEVRVIISDKYHLEILGDENELSRLDIESFGDKLVIEHKDLKRGFFGWFKSSYNSDRNKVKIIIHTKSLSELEFDGTGTLELEGLDEDDFELAIKGPIDAMVEGQANDLVIRNYGPGDIEFSDLKSELIDIDNYGPGDIKLSGISRRVKIAQFGPGNINAFDLETKELKAKVLGPGDIKMTVTDRVIATIMGPGDVKVKGNPEKIDESSFGPGNVVRY